MGKEYLDALLTVESPNGTYANAFIFDRYIITAHHLVENPNESIKITLPHTDKYGEYYFQQVAARDIARSHWPVNRQGFIEYEHLGIGDQVLVVGHHGSNRMPYEIITTTVEIFNNGGIVVEQQEGQKPFQPGMSGSVGITTKGSVVGILIRGGERRVVLEPFNSVNL